MNEDKNCKIVKLLGKVFITGEMKAETGLRIGTISSGLEVGGVENLVIRDALTNRPYLPGSSLKGKMRSLLTRKLGKPLKVLVSGGGRKPDICLHWCKNEDEYNSDGKPCVICRTFGLGAEFLPGEQTRLFVRDGFLLPEVETLGENEQGEFTSKRVCWDELRTKTDMPYTEVKMEAVIDVITSAATPRQMERVPAGALFSIDIVFNIYDAYDKDDCLKEVFEGLRLLEDDYLGGSGSRGYGKVSFNNLDLHWKPIQNYECPKKEPVPLLEKTNPQKALEGWNTIVQKIRL